MELMNASSIKVWTEGQASYIPVMAHVRHHFTYLVFLHSVLFSWNFKEKCHYLKMKIENIFMIILVEKVMLKFSFIQMFVYILYTQTYMHTIYIYQWWQSEWFKDPWWTPFVHEGTTLSIWLNYQVTKIDYQVTINKILLLLLLYTYKLFSWSSIERGINKQ